VADEFNIPTMSLRPRSHPGEHVNLLPAIPLGTDLVVLAGFMSIVSKETISKLDGKIINTHPSLLPKHGGVGMFGVNVHRAVLGSGDRWTGCTVHYVDEFVDKGEVIAQRRIRVINGETAWDLGGRVFELEGPLLVEIIREFSVRRA
jgi:phosphoribosylglycinamide formyltransferase-1